MVVRLWCDGGDSAMVVVRLSLVFKKVFRLWW